MFEGIKKPFLRLIALDHTQKINNVISGKSTPSLYTKMFYFLKY